MSLFLFKYVEFHFSAVPEPLQKNKNKKTPKTNELILQGQIKFIKKDVRNRKSQRLNLPSLNLNVKHQPALNRERGHNPPDPPPTCVTVT